MLRLKSPPFLGILNKSVRSSLLQQHGANVRAVSQEAAQERNDAGKEVDVGKQQAGGIEAAPAKLAAREPLVKNFFLGVVDRELLGFPEVVPREQMVSLQKDILPIKNFFTEEVDALVLDATRTVPASLLDNIQQLGLFGINVPKAHGGKGYEYTASLMASEPESHVTDITLGLLSHRVIVDMLKEVGTEAQKQQFLSKLASGFYVATEAIYEFDSSEEELFNTMAVHSPENGSWVIRGTKSFVVSGPLAAGSRQLFLVIAQTQHTDPSTKLGYGTIIFLVDAATPGVKLGDQLLTIGGRGLQIRNVKFDAVSVPESCIVGEPHDSSKIANRLLRSNRLRTSLIGLGLAKKVLGDVAEYATNTICWGTPLGEMEMTKVHLSKMMCSTYAIESMIYFTAGLMDEFTDQDVVLEAAITKYYTLKELLAITTRAMDVVGPKSLLSGQPLEVAFRNAAQLYSQGDSIDTLRSFIALSGLQYAGTQVQETVNKSRNPLFNPGHIFKKFLETSTYEHPKTEMKLNEHLHPTLEPSALHIEHSVARLGMCVEHLFVRHGRNIAQRHNEIHRLADISSVIYAMFTSASRASRSYCIGLQLADHEMLTAAAICRQGYDLVKTITQEIFTGQYLNNDQNLLHLSKQVSKSRGHFAQHPLTYNF